MRAWPRGAAWRRSGLHRRGSTTTSSPYVSTTSTPCRAAASRIRALSAGTRGASGRASGTSRSIAGKVRVATRAPAPVSAANIASSSAPTASASKRGRSRSFMPATTVARSGRNARAASSCVARTCPASCPRTARLAYRSPGSAASSNSASRSAHPRSPLASSPSPSPSVWLSPNATYRTTDIPAPSSSWSGPNPAPPVPRRLTASPIPPTNGRGHLSARPTLGRLRAPAGVQGRLFKPGPRLRPPPGPGRRPGPPVQARPALEANQ